MRESFYKKKLRTSLKKINYYAHFQGKIVYCVTLVILKLGEKNSQYSR